MSRLVKIDGPGTQRTRLLKAVGLALRELAGRSRVDDEVRDIAAFAALALHGVHASIDDTVRAWERRDYWLKADEFRREWAWAGQAAQDLERLVLRGEWHNLPIVISGLAGRLQKVKLPKRNNLGDAWLGAYARLREMRGLEKEWKVK